MTLKDRIIEYTDCPGCWHELSVHDELAGCLSIDTDNVDCPCILNKADVEHLREWWEEHPRMIND